MKYIDSIEKVQRMATTMLLDIKSLRNTDRLKNLKLPAPVYRRLRGVFRFYDTILGVNWDITVSHMIACKQTETAKK